MMIGNDTLSLAVDLLKNAAPEATIILFGSHARGDADEGSDWDFLLVKPFVHNRRLETARLLRVLEPYNIPVDLFVASHAFYDLWKDKPGTLLFDASREGKVLYEPCQNPSR